MLECPTVLLAEHCDLQLPLHHPSPRVPICFAAPAPSPPLACTTTCTAFINLASLLSGPNTFMTTILTHSCSQMWHSCSSFNIVINKQVKFFKIIHNELGLIAPTVVTMCAPQSACHHKMTEHSQHSLGPESMGYRPSTL